VPFDVSVMPVLQEAIDAMPASDPPDIPGDGRLGKPFTAAGFRHRQWISPSRAELAETPAQVLRCHSSFPLTRGLQLAALNFELWARVSYSLKQVSGCPRSWRGFLPACGGR